MLIHRVNEGEELHLGLNWRSDKMTFFSLKFLIPLYLFYSKKYQNFDLCGFYKGFRVRTLYFCFRIRRWKHFRPETKKIVYHHFNLGIRAIGKQQLLMTEEQVEDYESPDNYESPANFRRKFAKKTCKTC